MNVAARWKQFSIGVGATTFAIAAAIVLHGPSDSAESGITDAKFRLRGESPIDSSIVILYFDNDDIAKLGGWPLKRSYYALLVDALRELDARAIGFDIAFSEPDVHGPEYDDLFAAVIRRAGNVVLSGYFRDLSAEHASDVADSLPDQLILRTCNSSRVQTGTQFVKPIATLLNSAARMGHTNLTNDRVVPLVIRTMFNQYVPTLGYAVVLTASSHREGQPNNIAEIPGEPNGNVSLSYIGGTSSLTMVRAVDFLKSYDAWKAGGSSITTLDHFRGKIVLIGVVAEGRSAFVGMPFTAQFPSIGIHATFIHNALHGNFLRLGSPVLAYGVALIVGFLCTLYWSFRRELVGLLFTIGTILVVIVGSYLLFTTVLLVLPVVPTIVTAFAATGSILIYRHITVRKHADALSRELGDVMQSIHEKEVRLTALEQELANSLEKAEETETLRYQIRIHHSELARLKSLEADLTPISQSEHSSSERQEFCGIVYAGTSPMAKVIELVERVADTSATVLLIGETGTGKELVARAIHDRSSRRNHPFIAVNCGALAESLLENELFGHVRGAFTGATSDSAGRFEAADHGTIFLDEIGDMSEAFQVKLLRVLQDGTLQRVGSTQTTRVDARVIAATNRDLRKAVEAKQFREDLFYRLNVVAIDLPPLRDRAVDVPLLLDHFLTGEAPDVRCSAAVMTALTHYDWPGNVREVQSAVKRTLVLARAEGRRVLRLKDLPNDIASQWHASLDLEERVVSLLREKQFSHSAISEAAADLGGLNRGTVAEYFRGYSFKTFDEFGWNFSRTLEAVALSADTSTRERAGRKLSEYLQNAVDCVDQSLSLDEVLKRSKPKYKNLPRRYHQHLDRIIAAYYRSEWSIDFQSNTVPTNRLK